LIDPISWSYSGPYIAAALACGYLLGSIPFGLLLTRFAGLDDIRGIGSGNIGATNVLRTGRKSLAATTLLFDAGKGALAVWLGNYYGPDIAIVSGLGAMLGHLFPIWLRFSGGKGVATALGVILALSWQTGLAVLAVWIAVLALLRYSSLAALVASLAAPVIAYMLSTPQIMEFCVIICALVWFRHIGNIRRLFRGEESRIGSKSSS